MNTTSHYAPYDAPGVRMKQAVCGRWIRYPSEHSPQPTCAVCLEEMAKTDALESSDEDRRPTPSKAVEKPRRLREYVTTGAVVGGVFKMRNLTQFKAAMQAFGDGDVLVRIERAHATRSQQANRYYWGVVVDHIAQHTGYSPEETHDCLKLMFLPKKCAMVNGNGEIGGELVIGGSTTKLNAVDFYEYCERIREWARDFLQVEIPTPDSVAA